MQVQALVFVTILLGLYLLNRLHAIDLDKIPQIMTITFSGASLAVGALFASFFIRITLKPVRELMDATDKVASGDYSVRVLPRGLPYFRDLSEKFNHMTEELQSVELLRSDFVNNFSHEFKTPIGSICGFAKMLQDEDLSPAERNEYLSVIIEESERLSSLSTNVLKLSKLEQQNILTDKTEYNLSEQIRLCVALFSAEWDRKSMDVELIGDDVVYTGSKELLKQVWINLLDNAIKFTPNGGIVRITTEQTPDHVIVSMFNTGKPISEPAAIHIFDKFYQEDSSRKTAGSGLGLSIVRRIAALHRGSVAVRPEQDGNTFVVLLPQS